MSHELLHAAQDTATGGELFRPPVPLRWYQRALQWLVIENEAHLFGGPLIGVPLAILPEIVGVGGLIIGVYHLVGWLLYFMP
jgi:hypothetical protein